MQSTEVEKRIWNGLQKKFILVLDLPKWDTLSVTFSNCLLPHDHGRRKGARGEFTVSPWKNSFHSWQVNLFSLSDPFAIATEPAHLCVLQSELKARCRCWPLVRRRVTEISVCTARQRRNRPSSQACKITHDQLRTPQLPITRRSIVSCTYLTSGQQVRACDAVMDDCDEERVLLSWLPRVNVAEFILVYGGPGGASQPTSCASIPIDCLLRVFQFFSLCRNMNQQFLTLSWSRDPRTSSHYYVGSTNTQELVRSFRALVASRERAAQGSIPNKRNPGIHPSVASSLYFSSISQHFQLLVRAQGSLALWQAHSPMRQRFALEKLFFFKHEQVNIIC